VTAHPSPTLVEVQTALERRYLYGTGDYDEIIDRVRKISADPSHQSRERAAAGVLQGMAMHYSAIELPPSERAEIDPLPERQTFDAALAACDPHTEPHTAAGALFGLGLVEQVLQGDFELSAPRFVSAFEILAPSGDVDATLLGSEIVRHIGFDHLVRQNDLDAAVDWLMRSLRSRERLAESGWIASGHRALAMAYRRGGDMARAVEHAEHALASAERAGLRPSHIAGARDELVACKDLASSAEHPDR
jgi:tetratricopeptide (TPR) repeat protein